MENHEVDAPIPAVTAQKPKRTPRIRTQEQLEADRLRMQRVRDLKSKKKAEKIAREKEYGPDPTSEEEEEMLVTEVQDLLRSELMNFYTGKLKPKFKKVKAKRATGSGGPLQAIPASAQPSAPPSAPASAPPSAPPSAEGAEVSVAPQIKAAPTKVEGARAPSYSSSSWRRGLVAPRQSFPWPELRQEPRAGPQTFGGYNADRWLG